MFACRDDVNSPARIGPENGGVGDGYGNQGRSKRTRET